MPFEQTLVHNPSFDQLPFGTLLAGLFRMNHTTTMMIRKTNPMGSKPNLTLVDRWPNRTSNNEIISEAGIIARLHDCTGDTHIIRNRAVDDNPPPVCDQVPFHRPVDSDDCTKDYQIACNCSIEGKVVGDDI